MEIVENKALILRTRNPQKYECIPNSANLGLAPARLRQLLAYCRASGKFVWKERRAPLAPKGSVAGRVNAKGYREISVDGRRYLASRLAWLYVHGAWPAGEVDHKNGCRDDNRISNLRDVTKAGNQQNQRRPRKDSSLKLMGVCQTRSGRFAAAIQTNGVRVWLGSFASAEEAASSYLMAKRTMHATCTI